MRSSGKYLYWGSILACCIIGYSIEKKITSAQAKRGGVERTEKKCRVHQSREITAWKLIRSNCAGSVWDLIPSYCAFRITEEEKSENEKSCCTRESKKCALYTFGLAFFNCSLRLSPCHSEWIIFSLPHRLFTPPCHFHSSYLDNSTIDFSELCRPIFVRCKIERDFFSDKFGRLSSCMFYLAPLCLGVLVVCAKKNQLNTFTAYFLWTEIYFLWLKQTKLIFTLWIFLSIKHKQTTPYTA